MMGWFKQGWGSDPAAGADGQDVRGSYDSSYGTNVAILSATVTLAPPVHGVPGPARTDEIRRRQLALLESYVANVRIR